MLDRFCRAAARFGVRRVVRATGDNPLVSPAQVRSLLELHAAQGWQLSHYLGPPLGTGVEVVEARGPGRGRGGGPRTPTSAST